MSGSMGSPSLSQAEIALGRRVYLYLVAVVLGAGIGIVSAAVYSLNRAEVVIARHPPPDT